jgi:phospholipid/cholesterol/gamma-HCH transport system ATP-binding protein
MSSAHPTPPSRESRPPVIEISDLRLDSLSRDESSGEVVARSLFREVNLKAYEGEVILILGASGGGKSLLLSYLLNTNSPSTETLMINRDTSSEASFNLRLEGREYPLLQALYPDALTRKIGIMFQSLGLFEDMNVSENITFANDHASEPLPRSEWKGRLNEILSLLNLKEMRDASLSTLSGGQRQRVALGRMLAYKPRVMIFDEPTSALDPHTTASVVELIDRVHHDNQNDLTFIVTHDHQAFLDIADRVWFIQPTRVLEDHSPPLTADQYLEALNQDRVPIEPKLSTDTYLEHLATTRDLKFSTTIPRTISFLRRCRESIFRIRGSHSIIEPKLSLLNRLFRVEPWFLRSLRSFFKLIVIESLPFHLVAGFFLGVIATYFSFNLELGEVLIEREAGATPQAVQVSRFMLPAFFQEMLTGFGVVMYRAVIPIFTCMCVAARAGTAVTAYLASVRDPNKQQWDAMRYFGVEPFAFFVPQLLFCFCFGCVVLSYLSFLSASLGALLTSLVTNPLCTRFTWMNTYWSGLHPQFGLLFDGTSLFILKTALSGAVIASMSLYFGTKKYKDSREAMRAQSRANVMSVLLLLCTYFSILVFESGSL